MNLLLKSFLLKSSDPSATMPNCRKSIKFKNALPNGTLKFSALIDTEKYYKMSFWSENVEFLFVDILRTK